MSMLYVWKTKRILSLSILACRKIKTYFEVTNIKWDMILAYQTEIIYDWQKKIVIVIVLIIPNCTTAAVKMWNMVYEKDPCMSYGLHLECIQTTSCSCFCFCKFTTVVSFTVISACSYFNVLWQKTDFKWYITICTCRCTLSCSRIVLIF